MTSEQRIAAAQDMLPDRPYPPDDYYAAQSVWWEDAFAAAHERNADLRRRLADADAAAAVMRDALLTATDVLAQECGPSFKSDFEFCRAALASDAGRAVAERLAAAEKLRDYLDNEQRRNFNIDVRELLEAYDAAKRKDRIS